MASIRTGMAATYTRQCENGATETTPGLYNFNKVTPRYRAQVLEWLNEDGYYVDAEGFVFKAPKEEIVTPVEPEENPAA